MTDNDCEFLRWLGERLRDPEFAWHYRAAQARYATSHPAPLPIDGRRLRARTRRRTNGRKP